MARVAAFLTMEDTAGWSIDAGLAIPHLERRGWRVEWVPWRGSPRDWNAFDAVYMAAPWDYPRDAEGFLALLERIDRSRAVLVNDLALVRWNITKTYLRDIEARGVPIVPSAWLERLAPGELEPWFGHFRSDCLVVKPTVSTNATDTFVVQRSAAAGLEASLAAAFGGRPCLVQPFLPAVRSEGEYSLFFFGRRYSHAVLKSPRPGDFRVQEEHGAEIRPIEPEPALHAAASLIVDTVEPFPVYARCDLVRGAPGFLLMELELIEPSMYLRMDAAAPERFAAEFDRYVARRRARA